MALREDTLDGTTAERAKRLAKLLKHFMEQKMPAGESQQSELYKSLVILHKLLQHASDYTLLHGPTVARGYQLGGKHTTKGKLQWNTKVGGKNEMPNELMDLIEKYLTLNEVHELPGLGGSTHTHTDTHAATV